MNHPANMIVWSPGVTLEAIEEQIIKRALGHYRGNKTTTAQALGIAVRTLDNKLEKYFENDKKFEEGMEEEKKRRDDFLARCRGKVSAEPEKIEEKCGELIEDSESEKIVEGQDDSIQVTNLRSKKRG